MLVNKYGSAYTGRWIFCQLPLTKQVMAVSATYPEALAALVSRYTTDPAFIRPGQQRQTLVGVKQVACRVAYHPLSQQQAKNKLDVLLHLLQAVAFSQCIVFTNLQTRSDRDPNIKGKYYRTFDFTIDSSISSFRYQLRPVDLRLG